MYTDNYLRILIWTVCDGTIVDGNKYNPNSHKKRIQFKLSKERKIKALCELLANLDYEYTFKKATLSKTNKLQPYMIRIYGDFAKNIFNSLNGIKQFPDNFKKLDKNKLDIIIQELSITDGCYQDGILCFYTTNKNDLEILKYLCNKHEYKFRFKEYENTKGFGNKLLYYIYIDNRDRI